MQKNQSLFKIFYIFFKIGLVLFGGGYAMLPFLKSEIVEKEQICTLEEISDYYALSQCLPGLVAGNVAMFIGYKYKSLLGAFFAVFGVCLPAFLSIVLVFSFLNIIMGHHLIQDIFHVLDIAVCVLILMTILELWNISIKNKLTTTIFCLCLILSLLNISPFIIVILAGMIGLINYFMMFKKSGDVSE